VQGVKHRRAGEGPRSLSSARGQRPFARIQRFSYPCSASERQAMTVRTRFAPSPTGYLHLGGARTALFAWLHARHHGGRFVLRIEDTDRERSTEAFVEAILEGLRWLGIDHDEGPYFQSQRMALYRRYIERLLDANLAYRCYCTKEELERMRAEQMARGEKPRYDGRHREYRGAPPPGVDPVIRFKNPLEGEVVVNDLIRGRMLFANHELDDLIIARRDGTPTYNFTVVVDDLEMDISHVIRGDDHINNTPRQMNILRALDAEPPRYAHVPMILGPDGQRLSKRHGAVSVTQFREDGYLPEALVNYLVRLGWSHGDQEIFSRDEMIELFDVADVNRAAAAFDYEKLQWLNQHYMKTLDAERVAEELREQLRRLDIDPSGGPDLEALVVAQRERWKTVREMAENSLYFFRDFESYEEKAAEKHLGLSAQGPLERARERLSALETWEVESLQAAIGQAAEDEGVKLGKIAQPLRVAVTGRSFSPPIDVTLALLGRERTLARLDRALDWVSSRNGTDDG